MKSAVTVFKLGILLLAFAVVAAGSGWAQSEQQQSLGDIARKQKEKKGEEEQKGKKVFSNEDLPQGSATSGSPASSGSASSSAGSTGGEIGRASCRERV